MSSNESSGAPAEATATPPASIAAFPSSGSTRGSGLARGKRPNTGPVSASATAATSDYTPTAIEVVTAPREYQNPFAPATPEPAAPAPAPVAVAPAPAPAAESVAAPVATIIAEPAAVAGPEEPAELNILPPEQPKVTPAQTWESEGFRPAREPRNDRPRREERTERAPRERDSTPFDPATIPAKFLYVRPGFNYVPTPSNYGGAPRERERGPVADAPAAAAPAAYAPAKSGGFVAWLKSLFGSKPAEATATETHTDEFARDGQRPAGRQRGGRGRGPGGGQGEGFRRHRGGRGRGQRGGDYRGGGGDQGGPAAT